jgi:hypothetical protein
MPLLEHLTLKEMRVKIDAFRAEAPKSVCNVYRHFLSDSVARVDAFGGQGRVYRVSVALLMAALRLAPTRPS